MSGAVYTVHLKLKIEHAEGPELDWGPVATAAADELAGATLAIGRARFVVDAAEIDEGAA